MCLHWDIHAQVCESLPQMPQRDVGALLNAKLTKDIRRLSMKVQRQRYKTPRGYALPFLSTSSLLSAQIVCFLQHPAAQVDLCCHQSVGRAQQ